MPTVDGHDWSAKRLRFLQELLDDNPPDEQRAAIEAEMTELRASKGGWRRWLGLGRLPHQH